MALDLFVLRAVFSLGVVLLLIGAMAGWTSANVGKRLAGIAVALLGATLTLAALHAPSIMLIAGVMLATVYVIFGAALLVRIQESYGGLEVRELDAADAQSEPQEPAS